MCMDTSISYAFVRWAGFVLMFELCTHCLRYCNAVKMCIVFGADISRILCLYLQCVQCFIVIDFCVSFFWVWNYDFLCVICCLYLKGEEYWQSHSQFTSYTAEHNWSVYFGRNIRYSYILAPSYFWVLFLLLLMTSFKINSCKCRIQF